MLVLFTSLISEVLLVKQNIKQAHLKCNARYIIQPLFHPHKDVFVLSAAAGLHPQQWVNQCVSMYAFRWLEWSLVFNETVCKRKHTWHLLNGCLHLHLLYLRDVLTSASEQRHTCLHMSCCTETRQSWNFHPFSNVLNPHKTPCVVSSLFRNGIITATGWIHLCFEFL